MQKQILKMEGISKSFPGVKALQSAKLDLLEGEVHGLLGENGAGKSTLMNILGGVLKADAGTIFIAGKPAVINTVLEAQALGIAFIHQELALEPFLTVAENIFLGRELRNSLGMVSKKRMNESAKEYLETVGLFIDPDSSVSKLSTGQQQMVEIAKAFSLKARIIVMDEPTSSLSEREVEILFQTIRKLQKQGIGIIYISHKMSEIFDLTDRITVMRDGQYIGTKNTKETDTDQLVHMMVGCDVKNYYVRTYNQPGEEALKVTNISAAARVKNCSFSVHKGEILGFYGLIGSGRSELMQAIMGLLPREGGQIYINGEKINRLTPLQTQKKGMVLVPENRKTQGLFLGNTVKFNTTISILDRFIRYLKVNHRTEQKIVADAITAMAIKTPSKEQQVGNLSGGNQQKIVLAKWLATNPQILILDEPTRGIDIGAKAEIYKIINDLAKQGIAIIMISSELPEIINMCDRLAVMSEGRLAGILKREEMIQSKILNFALSGGDR